MTAQVLTLLNDLTKRGIKLRSVPGEPTRLKVWPSCELTPTDLRQIQTHKIELLDFVRRWIESPNRPRPWRPGEPSYRQQAAHLLRQARLSGRSSEAIALRDAWRERLAIVTVDGGLNLDDAQAVATSEVMETWNAIQPTN